MYFWGDYYDGFKVKIPELIYDFESILLDISFGLKHALALLENGKVFSWGDGSYGELG
jgi:alpha-tubulin suppressor-like RCC1 family protein